MSPLTRQRQTSNFEIRQVSKRKKEWTTPRECMSRITRQFLIHFILSSSLAILWPIGNLVAFKFYAKCERADAK